MTAHDKLELLLFLDANRYSHRCCSQYQWTTTWWALWAVKCLCDHQWALSIHHCAMLLLMWRGWSLTCDSKYLILLHVIIAYCILMWNHISLYTVYRFTHHFYIPIILYLCSVIHPYILHLCLIIQMHKHSIHPCAIILCHCTLIKYFSLAIILCLNGGYCTYKHTLCFSYLSLFHCLCLLHFILSHAH